MAKTATFLIYLITNIDYISLRAYNCGADPNISINGLS